MRLLFAAAVLCLPLHAQFNDMVTNTDGSIVLFRSAWRLAGTNDGDLQKIYRLDSRGFTLVFSPVDTGQIVPPSVAPPFISADGSIFGYTAIPGCAGSTCSTTKPILVLNGAAIPSALPQVMPFQLSANGRYLAASLTVVDRTTGVAQVATGGAVPVGGRFGIGNNGGVLTLLLHPLFVTSFIDLLLSTKPGVTIGTANIITGAVVSAAENRVVYEARSFSGTGRQLFAYDFATAQTTALDQSDPGSVLADSIFQPSISNDGARVLYSRFNSTTGLAEAVVHDFTSGVNIVLGPMLTARNNFVISGDGKSAWLHRADGRLAHVNIDSLQADLVAGRHAWIDSRDGGPVFGSFNRLYGGGFTPDATLPVPSDLSLTLAGLTPPLLRATSRELDFQIPWEAILNSTETLMLHSASSPFESLLPINMTLLSPTFERTGRPGDLTRSVITVHQDFHGLVTFADPAIPGEIVHFYLTGLGDVQPRPATGAPSPFNPLAIAQRPQCLLSFDVQEEIAPVTFAGLAPGLVGMYQMDVRIPLDFGPSVAILSCFEQNGSGPITGDLGSFPIAKR
jgi:uncharacterized protein (TIGR03437 family)